MLDIPENIKELFRSDNNRVETVKHLKLRFYDKDISLLFPDNMLFPSDELFPIDMEPFLIIENDRINTESFTLTESLCESEDLTFGECNASKIEVTVADITLDVTGKEFLATLDIDGYELAFGIYRVESFIRQADRRMRKITAYDRMRYFQKDVSAWYNALSFPMTLRQFRNSLCENIGVKEVSVTLPLDDLKITKTIEPQQISGLNILQAVCEINGCFGHMDKTGRLKFISLGITSLFPANDLYPSEDLYPAEMLNAENVSHYRPQETTYEDYLVYGIDKVQIRQEEGDVGAIYGDGENTYIIQGNFLAYGKSANELLQITATVYDEIKGRAYRPCKISCPAFPWVEVGDGLICHTTNDIIETYCMKRTISGIQAMRDIFEATGVQKREEDFGIGTQIIQLEGKTTVIKKSVDEVSVKVADLKEYTEAQFRITAEQILAEVTRAKAEEEKLSASITVNAEQIALKVSKGEVSSQLSVESDKVTIRGNRLIVDSTNFKLDGDGNATFSGNVTGAQISGGMISGATMSVGPLKADDTGVTIGDFSISVDQKYQFRSNDGRVSITTGNAPGGKESVLSIDRILAQNEDISGALYAGVVYCEDKYFSHFYDIQLGKSWWQNETISQTVQELWERVETLSDRTAKKNIISIDTEEALTFLLSSNPVTFQYKRDGQWKSGFIAQEVEETEDALEIYYPLVGIEKRSQKYKIDYIGYIPLIVAAIQNIQNQIINLEGKV